MTKNIEVGATINEQLLEAAKRAINYSQNVLKAEGVSFDEDEDLPFIVAAIKQAEPVAQCNECEWEGPVSETSMCGSIGPLCPDCRETCQVSYPSKTDAPPHPDDEAVDRFAQAMKQKLAQAREKGRSGWQQMNPADLSAMLYEHVEKGDTRDVANFCMFLWSLGQPITPCKPIQAEHFEREWYLRGDEIEALKAEKNKQAKPVGYIHKDDLKELLSDNAIGQHWLTVLFKLSDPDVVALYTHPAPAVAVNERLLCAAKKYFMSYCRDEASEFGPDDTGCSQEQHKDAVELGEAITAAEAAKGGE